MSGPDGSKMVPVLLAVGSVSYAGLERVNAAAVGGLERFRSDAKAEGDLVTIGAYETHDEEGSPIETTAARWFSLKLDKHNAPWAFEKGEPFRTIASLELLGSLLGVMLLVDEWGRAQGNHGGVLSVGGPHR